MEDGEMWVYTIDFPSSHEFSKQYMMAKVNITKPSDTQGNVI